MEREDSRYVYATIVQDCIEVIFVSMKTVLEHIPSLGAILDIATKFRGASMHFTLRRHDDGAGEQKSALKAHSCHTTIGW